MAQEKNACTGNGCPLVKKCGGCQLQNMTYSEQLRFKQGKLIALLGKFGHINDIVGMDDPLHYRCKVQAAFGWRSGHVISGVYQSSSHRIVPVDSCMIEDGDADRIVVTIRRLAESFKLRVFNEDAMSGFLRHVLVRKGCFSRQIMVVIVTGQREFPSRRAFINELLRIHPEITTVVQSINSKRTSLVLGTENITLFGAGYIEDTLLGRRFRISPASFYQVNPRMTEKLYEAAVGALSLSGKERVIDAYCGTGTIGLIAAADAKEVIGVEQNKDAVRDAIKNAAANGADNIRFIKADATEYLIAAAQAREHFDALIMDPPRAGSTPRFIQSAVSIAPEKIVYVSCNPETLARDLALFVKYGYAVRSIRPFDMFPHTEHVETVVLMSKS